ncbi:MAG: SRPBCC family protein [Actinomycetota bacterium]|nr:SRPBCC family protein [Actinomycetota bacterium]
MTEEVREHIVVHAGSDAVMDTISDFERYPEWQAEVLEVDVLEADDQGLATRVRFLFDARIVRVAMVLAYTYAPDAMRWRLVEGDQVRRNDGAYLLRERPDGSTEVTYELAVEPTVAVPAVVRRSVARHIVDGALRGMKRRVEAGAGR